MIDDADNPGILDLTVLNGDGATPLADMYRALVEEIPAILYINGPEEDSPTLYVSPQTEAILGLPASAWYDNTWSDHVHPDDRESLERNYVGFLRKAQVGSDEYRFIKPDGEEIWLHDTVRVIRDAEGEPALVQGIMFDITMRKHNEELLAAQARAMSRIEAIGHRFTEILLAGGELQELLDALAEVVNGPVVFGDAAHQLVGFSATREIGDSELLQRWEQHSREVHDTDQSPGCVSAFVRLRDEEWGRLHAFTAADQPDEIDALAVDRAAAAIGLWLLSGRERASLADHARSELIADLWQGTRWNEDDALARSRSLGGDLDRPVLFGIAVRLGEESGEGTALTRLLGTARSHLEAVARSEAATSMTAVVDSACLGIIGLPRDGQERIVKNRLALKVQQRLSDELGQRIIAVGVSRPGSASTLRRLLTEANDAAAYGAFSARATGTYHSADLGLRNLLARLDEGPELGRFVEEELGPLLSQDARGGIPLIPTLRAYVDSGGNKAEAARLLHLERRSLYYRLARIESLLGTNLDDPSVRLRAQVALQGLDVLRQRAAIRTPSTTTA